MVKLINLVFFILLLSNSCTNKVEKKSDLRSLASEYIEVNGTIISNDSIIESANIVAFFEDKIITRIYGDYIFTVYQYNEINDSLKYFGNFGKRGNGPFEFSGPVECFYDEEHSQLYLSDLQGNNIKSYKIDLNSVDNLFKTETWKIITMPVIEKSFLTSLIPIENNSFIALGGNLERKNLLSLVNYEAGTIEDLDVFYPDDGVNVEPVTKRFVYNNGQLLKRPSTNDFIYYCTNWGNYVQMIKNTGERIVQNSIVTNYPQYKLSSDGIQFESEMQTLMGMRSYVTDKYIYLLPNFKTKKEFLAEENSNSQYSGFHMDKIYVFDWDGNYIRAYQLQVPIMQHIVMDDKYIIGTSVDPESGDIVFVKFDLLEKILKSDEL